MNDMRWLIESSLWSTTAA